MCQKRHCQEHTIIPICIGCHKQPHEIQEYVDSYEADSEYFKSPADMVRRDEGTYNKDNGHYRKALSRQKA